MVVKCLILEPRTVLFCSRLSALIVIGVSTFYWFETINHQFRYQGKLTIMKIIDIDTTKIIDRQSFHAYFKDTFGFPDFYGNNMDAWIDCMTYLDEPNSGMTSKVFVEKNNAVVINLLNVADFIKRVPTLYNGLVECSAFVNYRRIEIGDNPVIFLSFFKNLNETD